MISLLHTQKADLINIYMEIKIFFLKINRIIFLSVSSVITTILSLIISYLLFIIHPNENDIGFTSEKITVEIIVSILIAPVIETAFFFTSIFLIIKYLKKNMLYFVIISSILFGLSHYYSVDYIFYSSFIGIILSIFYIISEKRKQGNGFLDIVIIHSFYNLIIFIGRHFL